METAHFMVFSSKEKAANSSVERKENECFNFAENCVCMFFFMYPIAVQSPVNGNHNSPAAAEVAEFAKIDALPGAEI